jgi:hypothetical protein
MDGMTQADAAQALRVPAAAVARWLSRGLRLVTEQLADLRTGEKPSDAIEVHTGEEWVLWMSGSWHAAASRSPAMACESRVQQLLEELGDSGCTPEEVCAACPELLPEVRRRWLRMCAVKADLHALFPTPGTDPDATRGYTPVHGHMRAELPQIPGYEVEALLGHGGMGLVYKAGTSGSTASSPSRC